MSESRSTEQLDDTAGSTDSVRKAESYEYHDLTSGFLGNQTVLEPVDPPAPLEGIEDEETPFEELRTNEDRPKRIGRTVFFGVIVAIFVLVLILSQLQNVGRALI